MAVDHRERDRICQVLQDIQFDLSMAIDCADWTLAKRLRDNLETRIQEYILLKV